MDVELALKINKLIHDECKDVPHDIGLRVLQLVENGGNVRNCDTCKYCCIPEDRIMCELHGYDEWEKE